MSHIPKIIHQTWKNHKLTPDYQKFVNSWKRLHPTWEYRFYDDDDCLKLVKTHFPQFLNAYNSLPTPVMKADMFRYLVIYQFGGLYVDIDAEALKSLDDLLVGDAKMIVGVEIEFTNFSKLAPIHKHFYHQYGINRQYTQYCFLSVPFNPILLEISKSIAKNIDINFHQNKQLNTIIKTGPGIFTQIIQKYKNKDYPVKILGLEYFSGITNAVLHYVFGINNPHPKSYIKHHECASWRNKDDIIYTILCCVIIALFIAFLVLFTYGIIYFNKCKKSRKRGKKCIPLITYCKIKKIMIIISAILIFIIIILMINFAIRDKAYWPF